MFPIPTSVFLTRGVGVHRHLLAAFELALRDADIEQQNLVTVSSILPPGCEADPAEAGVATLQARRDHLLRHGARRDKRAGAAHHASIGLARPDRPRRCTATSPSTTAMG